MGMEQAKLVFPYMDEGYKLLREKYKCGANEANDLVREFFNHIFYKWPEDRVVKNPRREFLHGLRVNIKGHLEPVKGIQMAFLASMAERQGFEPWNRVTPVNGLASRRNRPLCHLSVYSARTISSIPWTCIRFGACRHRGNKPPQRMWLTCATSLMHSPPGSSRQALPTSRQSRPAS
jgi:hypothetical protein